MTTAAGMAAGLAAAVGLSRLLANLLFGVSALDAATFAAVGVLLLLVAGAAAIPSRAAARVDPLMALRED